MENLFYSHDEKILFYIGGYHYNSTNLNDLITNLQESREIIGKYVGLNHKEVVYTDEIRESRRYKYMRVIWTKLNKAPKDAFVIGAGEHKWTMNEWLKG